MRMIVTWGGGIHIVYEPKGLLDKPAVKRGEDLYYLLYVKRLLFLRFRGCQKQKKKKKTASHFRSDEVVNKVAKSLWNVDPCLLLQRERKKQIAVKVYCDSLTPWPAPGGFYCVVFPRGSRLERCGLFLIKMSSERGREGR